MMNSVNFGSMPFVSTFESRLPRYFEDSEINMRLLLSRMISSSCTAMLAMSNFALKFQMSFLAPYLDAYLTDLIFSKTFVMHPPQAIINHAPHVHDDQIRFVFIGNDFSRKGGMELLDAFIKLRTRYNNFSLYIISNFYIEHNCNILHTDKDEMSKAKEIIRTLSWIELHENLSHENTLEIISQCHVGLLPSYMETYDFSVLEMQAAGMPVITTNIAAFPEINSTQCGWLIDLPGGSLSMATPKATREEARKHCGEALFAILSSIMASPESIATRGTNALARIRCCHSPAAYAERLDAIYTDTFQKLELGQKGRSSHA